MTHEAWVTLLVLAGALLHACWNALVKTNQDRLLTLATVSGVGLIVGLSLAPFLPVPLPSVWPYLAVGVFFHTGFKGFLLLAYRTGDLSRVYPLARGSAPLLVAFVSGMVVQEWLSFMEMIGVALVSLGLASLALEKGLPRRGELGTLVFSLLTGVFIAGYTLVDGMGVRLSTGHIPVDGGTKGGDPTDSVAVILGYTIWIFIFDALPLIALTLWLRRGRGRLRAYYTASAIPSIAAGSFSLLAYFLVIWALSLGAMAPIAALRETGVIFAALLGTLVLKEPFGRVRLMAACLVAGGVALLGLNL